MANKLLSVNVKGKKHMWSFNFYGDPAYIPDWEADGLEVVQIYNTIPAWVWQLGLTRPWCFLQDIFNLRNPFNHTARWK